MLASDITLYHLWCFLIALGVFIVVFVWFWIGQRVAYLAKRCDQLIDSSAHFDEPLKGKVLQMGATKARILGNTGCMLHFKKEPDLVPVIFWPVVLVGLIGRFFGHRLRERQKQKERVKDNLEDL